MMLNVKGDKAKKELTSSTVTVLTSSFSSLAMEDSISESASLAAEAAWLLDEASALLSVDGRAGRFRLSPSALVNPSTTTKRGSTEGMGEAKEGQDAVETG